MAMETLQSSVEFSQDPSINWGGFLSRIRSEAYDVARVGVGIATFSSLIAIAGLLSWRPRCGEWQGDGTEGDGPSAPNRDVPPVPPRIMKAISEPVRYDTIPVDPVRTWRHNNKLTQDSGLLESHGMFEGTHAKRRTSPSTDTHGRKTDIYHGGYPKPDSRPHAHDILYVRGDGDETLIFDRERDKTVTYDSEIELKFDAETRIYTWTPQGREER